MAQVSSLRTGIKYKDTPIGKIPVDWEVVKLGDISEEIYRYPTYYNIKYVDQNQGVPEIRGELIKNNGELPNDLSAYRHISKETSSMFPRTILHEGDFVLSVRGTMGKIGYVTSRLENANMTANLMRISPNRHRVHPLWMKQFFLSEFFQNRLEEASSATTIKTIKAPELKAIEIALPLFLEQKKIAEILTTVDEAIEKTAQVIDNIKQVKKGLMQKLLTRGIGHNRFKKTEIGEIPEEWKVKKLVDTARNEKYSLTGGPFGSDLKEDSYTESGVRVIQLQNIGDGKFLDEYRVFTSEEKADQLKNCNIYPGDIIIAKMADPVARACMIPGSDDRYLMASDGIRLSVNKTKHDVNFVLYAINSPYFRKNAEKHSTGTTRLRIGLTELKNLPIGIPPLEEQKQITEILSSVDGEIERESGHKERLELLKKGLMQVLLTGKIRVVL
jgi:type I restriction enzyme S subunit